MLAAMLVTLTASSRGHAQQGAPARCPQIRTPSSLPDGGRRSIARDSPPAATATSARRSATERASSARDPYTEHKHLVEAYTRNPVSWNPASTSTRPAPNFYKARPNAMKAMAGLQQQQIARSGLE
jgi:hypothetical protein